MADRRSKKQHVANNGGMGFAYFLGIIGAAVYFVGQAHGFGEVIVALLKALVWPGFLVYELLSFINA
jgi:hypothetical protein